jgi:hypothetical protein
LFGQLKAAFKAHVDKIRRANPERVLVKWDLPELLEPLWEQVHNAASIRRAARKAGLFPVNVHWVEQNKDKFATSQPFRSRAQSAASDQSPPSAPSSSHAVNSTAPAAAAGSDSRPPAGTAQPAVSTSSPLSTSTTDDMHARADSLLTMPSVSGKNKTKQSQPRRNPLGETVSAARVANEPDRLQQLIQFHAEQPEKQPSRTQSQSQAQSQSRAQPGRRRAREDDADFVPPPATRRRRDSTAADSSVSDSAAAGASQTQSASEHSARSRRQPSERWLNVVALRAIAECDAALFEGNSGAKPD